MAFDPGFCAPLFRSLRRWPTTTTLNQNNVELYVVPGSRLLLISTTVPPTDIFRHELSRIRFVRRQRHASEVQGGGKSHLKVLLVLFSRHLDAALPNATVHASLASPGDVYATTRTRSTLEENLSRRSAKRTRVRWTSSVCSRPRVPGRRSFETRLLYAAIKVVIFSNNRVEYTCANFVAKHPNEFRDPKNDRRPKCLNPTGMYYFVHDNPTFFF